MLAKAAAGKTRMATLALHLWTQAAASLIALAGFYAIYKNKKNNGAEHFTSMVRRTVPHESPLRIHTCTRVVHPFRSAPPPSHNLVLLV